jgi:regulator of protease activity HflC (stomatin/prohibitin superfamily)
MGKFIAMVLALVLLAVGLIDLVEPNGWGFLGKVGNGNVAVVTRFGKAQDEVLEPGMHIKSYFSTLNPMSTQTQKVQIPLAAFSSDIQQVNAVVTLNYNVDKTNAVTLFREVGKDYVGSLMSPRIQENTKIVFSHYTAENLVQKRDTLSAEILTLMQEDLAPYGINVSAVAIEDIDFTDAFTNAVEAKQVATQEKLTAQTQQERLTMEATAEAERAKIEATAAAERQKIAAEAEAYAVTVRAEAEAEANAKVAASLTQELIDYTKAQLWNGEMPAVMGDATPILDMTDFAFGE